MPESSCWAFGCQTHMAIHCRQQVIDFVKCQQRQNVLASEIVAKTVPYTVQQSQHNQAASVSLSESSSSNSESDLGCVNQFHTMTRCLVSDIFVEYPDYNQICKREHGLMMKEWSQTNETNSSEKKVRNKILSLWRDCTAKSFRMPLEQTFRHVENGGELKHGTRPNKYGHFDGVFMNQNS